MVKDTYKNKSKNAELVQKEEELMINRLMFVFVGIFVLIGALLLMTKFNDKQVYFYIMPVVRWIILALFGCSVIYFAILRIKKVDESNFLVRSPFIICALAILYGGFTLYSYMKITFVSLILIFVLFTVLYFVCTIFASKVSIGKNK